MKKKQVGGVKILFIQISVFTCFLFDWFGGLQIGTFKFIFPPLFKEILHGSCLKFGICEAWC